MNIQISNPGQSLIALGEPRTKDEMVARYKARRARWAAMASAMVRQQRETEEAAIGVQSRQIWLLAIFIETHRLVELRRRELERGQPVAPSLGPRAVAFGIIKNISTRTGIPIAQIVGESRCKEIVSARFAAIYDVWQATGWSQTHLGAMFGDRDHSTILHALQKEKARRAAETPSNA